MGIGGQRTAPSRVSQAACDLGGCGHHCWPAAQQEAAPHLLQLGLPVSIQTVNQGVSVSQMQSF